MKNKVAKGWAVFAVIMPLLVGLAFVFNAGALVPAGATVADFAVTVGFRNIALAIPMIAAIFYKKWDIVAYLLIARGLSEFGDATSLMIANGFDVSIISTYVLGALSLLAAFVLLRATPNNA